MLMHPLLQSDIEDDCSSYDVERKSATWASIEPADSRTRGSYRIWSYIYRVLHWTQILTLFSKPATAVPNPTARPAAASSRTSSYDGLRGLACLIVFNFHFLYPYTKTTWRGYGVEFGKTEIHHETWFHQLPIICLVARGRAMVVLFFAISGYVLSSNYLATVRSGDWVKAYSKLASLTFRRWMRLYLPASISMLMVCFAAYLGAFEASGKFNKGNSLRTGEWEHHPPRFKTATAQLRNFGEMYYEWTSPWQWRFYWGVYDPHTWTIPVEFKGSMILFLLLLGSTALKERWRTGLFCFMTWYWFYSNRWDAATFTGGALVADLHQYSSTKSRSAKELSTLPITTPPSDSESAPFIPAATLDDEKTPPVLSSRRKEHIKTALKWLVLFIGLYGLSYPDELAGKTPGFKWLGAHLPRGYKTALASMPILWSVEKLPPVRNFLSSSIPQYLGKISYALYLVHGPLLHSIGMNLQPRLFKSVTGHNTLPKWLFGLAIGYVIMLALAIGVGHLFWKYVDAPLVRFARWLERMVTEREAFKQQTPKVVIS